MRKKGGGSKENTFNPTEMPKEDPSRRAGVAEKAPEGSKILEVAELAIDDCKYKECDFKDNK